MVHQEVYLVSNNYYVYKHIRLDTNTPFYVGKGIGKRAFAKAARNFYHQNIVSKYDYKVIFLHTNLTELEALELEKEWIATYKAYGYCEANMTNGGDGISGYKFTEESKKKKSIRFTGSNNPMYNKIGFLNPMFGRKRTKEEKLKISIAVKKGMEGKENPFKNKLHSLESKEKMSLSLKGRLAPNRGKKLFIDSITSKKSYR